jgi:hypothetical protein
VDTQGRRGGGCKGEEELFIFLAKLNHKISFQENQDKVPKKHEAKTKRPPGGGEASAGSRNQISINHKFTCKFINIKWTLLFPMGCFPSPENWGNVAAYRKPARRGVQSKRRGCQGQLPVGI